MYKKYFFILFWLWSYGTNAASFELEVKHIFGRYFEEIHRIANTYKIDQDQKKQTAFLTYIQAIRKHLKIGTTPLNSNNEKAAFHFVEFTLWATQGFTCFKSRSFPQTYEKDTDKLLEINSEAYTLLQYLWQHDFQREPTYQSDRQRATLAPEFQKVIDLIELAEHDAEKAFLKCYPTPNYSPYLLFTELAESLKTEVNSPDEIQPVFAKLAFLYLMKSLEKGTYLKDSSRGYFAFLKLAQDIHKAWTTDTASYRWFIYTIQRMLMIEMMRVKPYVQNHINTYFNVYYLSFFSFPLFDERHYADEKSFREMVDNHASFNGRRRITPNALANLFPHMIFLPLPFEMTPLEMVKLTDEHKWWALGYAFSPKLTDNFSIPLPPLLYYGHDVQHWDAIRSFATYLGVSKNPEGDRLELTDENIRSAKQYIQKGLRLFDRWRHLLRRAVEQKSSLEKQHYFALFALDQMHERIDGLLTHLLSCLCLLQANYHIEIGNHVSDYGAHLEKLFSPSGPFWYDMPLSFQERDEKDRLDIILTQLKAFADTVRSFEEYAPLYQETLHYLTEEIDENLPSLSKMAYDPTAYMPTLPFTNQNYVLTPMTWHYVYHFKFVHFNWDEHTPNEKAVFKTFATCFPAFKNYPKFGKLTVENQYETDLPQDTYEYDRLHFGDLMPNGQEIDMAIPLWRERFTFLP